MTAAYTNPTEATARVDALAAQGVDGIKVVLESGGAGFLFERLDLAVFDAVAAAAKRHNLPIVVHTGTPQDIKDAADRNVAGIEHGAIRDIMPDDRRFAVIWMSEKALASAYDLKGAFSSVSLKLLRDASERDVMQRLDALLERYGGRAAHGRKEQTSHAWLDHELDMLNSMSRTLPPIFLLVSAFLVNVTLTRILALEREQVGLCHGAGVTAGRGAGRGPVGAGK